MHPKKSASARESRTRPLALIVDDEPYHLNFLVEFLEVNGHRCEVAGNLAQGVEFIKASERSKYALLVIDLGIPTAGFVEKIPKEKADIYQAYPGLHAARTARNYGYRGHDVLVYSVHGNERVLAEVQLLGCRYMLKGRPGATKIEVMKILGL